MSNLLVPPHETRQRSSNRVASPSQAKPALVRQRLWRATCTMGCISMAHDRQDAMHPLWAVREEPVEGAAALAMPLHQRRHLIFHVSRPGQQVVRRSPKRRCKDLHERQTAVGSSQVAPLWNCRPAPQVHGSWRTWAVCLVQGTALQQDPGSH